MIRIDLFTLLQSDRGQGDRIQRQRLYIHNYLAGYNWRIQNVYSILNVVNFVNVEKCTGTNE